MHAVTTNTQGVLMKRQMAGLAAAALVSTGMSLAALGLGAGTAQADTWCPGQPVPGGFVEVDWDWTVCHNYYAMSRGYPPQIVGLKVQDGAIGGSWRLVAGEDTNVTCQFLGCPRP
jgi:hypothetical protein